MTLLFQHPGLLGLLALAALPLLVHLMSRARPPVYRFSNLEFLQRLMRRAIRLRRPQNWLLWTLRTLALLAVAAAFAAPVLVSKQAALPGEPSTVLLVIDRSASMAAREGVGSRFDLACSKAVEFLKEANPDEANLIWLDAEPEAVFPEPGPNIGYLREQLNQASPVIESGALQEAFDLALRQLALADGHRELVIISDFQATAWREFDLRVPDGVVLRREKVASSAPANVAISRLIPQPSEPVAGQDLTLLVGVQNFSNESVRTEVTLDAGGARQSQPVNLPPWGSSECAFVVRPAHAGPLPISTRVEADAFPTDDARYLVVKVRDFLRLAIDSSTREPDAAVLRKFAGALTWIEVGDSAGRADDLRFIGAWAGGEVASLRKQAADGTMLIVRPAPGCKLASLRELMGLPNEALDSPLSLDVLAAGWSVIPGENHPANSLFRSGDFGNPYAGNFRERLHLPKELAAASGPQQVAMYADGVPALLECQTAGASILIWNLPLDPAKTDWPIQGNFLPAVAEVLLRSRRHGGAEPAYSMPGQQIHWLSPEALSNGTVSLVDPSSAEIEIHASTTPDGSVWQSGAIESNGLYRWQVSGQAVAYSAVNFPQEESDLRPLGELPDVGSSSRNSDSLVRQAVLAHGVSIWHWLVAAALVMMVFESLIHLRSVAKPAPQP